MILPVSCNIDLDFDKAKVWSIISKPENLNLTHPFCKSNISLSWDNGNHRDSLEYLNGVKLYRDFYKWDEGNGYELKIGKKNGRKSIVKWKLIDKANSRSNLTITVLPNIYSNKNKIIYLIAYFFVIKPGISKYLKSVLNGYKWYLVNESPVPRNHFGSHKWFS